MDEVTQPPSFDGAGESSDDLGARGRRCWRRPRKVALFAAGVASQRFMTALQDQQEVMADLADMIGRSMRWSRRCCGRGSSPTEAAARQRSQRP